MGRVAAIGSETSVGGYRLAGVVVLAAEDADQARAAWERLPADVDLVLLTPPSAAAIDTAAPDTPAPRTAAPDTAAPDTAAPRTAAVDRPVGPLTAVLPP